jgi:hypothetical protein
VHAHSTFSGSVQGALTQRAGGTPDANAVVDAVVRTWQSMAAQLEPVIGVRGVNVLLERALHLTGKKFPWLAQAEPTGAATPTPTPTAIQLQARFARRDATEAAEAGCALLVTFTELLASLVGEPLTERLLATVWLDTPPPPAQEPPP